MQAIIKGDLWNHFENIIEEGNVYDVAHFSTTIASGSFRPVRSGINIMFKNGTTVMPIAEENIEIPIHKFEFSELEDLRDIVNSFSELRNPPYSTGINILFSRN